MYACGRGNIDMVRYLLSHGANPLFVHETVSQAYVAWQCQWLLLGRIQDALVTLRSLEFLSVESS